VGKQEYSELCSCIIVPNKTNLQFLLCNLLSYNHSRIIVEPTVLLVSGNSDDERANVAGKRARSDNKRRFTNIITLLQSVSRLQFILFYLFYFSSILPPVFARYINFSIYVDIIYI
jgi:hypothetical protein